MTTTVAILDAILRGDASSFVKSTTDAAKGADALGKQAQDTNRRMGELGENMTKKVTLPILAAGAAAIKVSVDFDNSMTKISGLVGIAGAELEGLRTGVLGLAGDTGRAPKELSEALFFVTSSGLRGAEAMDAMEAAAKGAAAGLGETKDIALVAAGAVNAYGAANMDAVRAVDVLTGTARAGNFEVSQLAGSIGQVLPIASAASVELEQVGGAIALLTRNGTGASEAVTQVKAAILAMNAPTEEARKILDGVEGGADRLQEILAGPNGLVEGFRFVEEAAGGNESKMRLLLGSQEALTAGLSILAADNDTLAATFDAVADSAGVTDEAFKVASETAGFKMNQAWAKLQVAMIKFGDAVLPLIADVAGGIGSLADVFSSIPGPVQKVIAMFAGLAAAVGPGLMITSKLVTSYQTLTTAWAKNVEQGGAITGTLGRVQNAVSSLGSVVAAGAAVWVSYQTMVKEAERSGEEAAKSWQESILSNSGSVDEFRGKLQTLSDQVISMAEDADATSWNPLDKDYRDAIHAANEETIRFIAEGEKMAQMADRMGGYFGKTSDQVLEWLIAQKELGVVFENDMDAMTAYQDSLAPYTNAVEELGAEFSGTEAEISGATDALAEWSDKVNAQFDPLFGMLDGLEGLASSQDAVTDAQTALNEAWATGDAAAAADATRDLEAAQVGLLKSNVDLDIAARELALAVASNTTSLDDAKGAIDGWAAAGRIGAESAAALKTKLDEATWAALLLDSQSPLVTAQADTSQAIAALSQVWSLIQSISAASGASLPSSLGHAMELVGATHAGATGGLITSPTTLLAGERSRPELLLPLDDPTRSAALLDSVGYGDTGGGGGTVINVEVNVMGRATAEDGAAVVEAIRAYERQNSSAWRGGR